MSFPTMVALSAGLHLLLVVLVGLTILIMQFLGFQIPWLNPLQMKQRDIEFVLVHNPPAPPRNPTKNRAEKSSRSGGEKIKNMPQAEPQRAAGAKQPTPKKASAPPSKTSKPTPKASQPVQRPTPQPRQAAQQPSPQPAEQPRKAPPAPKPPTKAPPRQTLAKAPPNPIASAIRTPMPGNPSAVKTGPVVSTPGSGAASGSRGGGAPGPAAIPGSLSRASGSPGGSGGSAGGQRGDGGSGSYTQSGSPGGGGGPAGVDAQAEPDFGPYIAELQRRIKRNWHPPSADRSKRVVAFFTISRDGRLLNVRIQQSSGTEVADAAATAAVRSSAPFRPLPANFRGQSIDVQFIFDYDVYSGASRQR
ncbi:MAG: TonB family protein [Candidatus Melainabacteria bacterium]